MMIIKLKSPLSMKQIMRFKNLKYFFEKHFFYENNREITSSTKLTEGVHLIRFYSKLFGGEDFRIIIEEEHNLIILTVTQMIEWKEILENHNLYNLQDCNFYLNSSRLYVNDNLGNGIYYIHFVRRMKARNNFWFYWKEENKIILILEKYQQSNSRKISKTQS
jgi:hypothetical protein